MELILTIIGILILGFQYILYNEVQKIHSMNDHNNSLMYDSLESCRSILEKIFSTHDLINSLTHQIHRSFLEPKAAETKPTKPNNWEKLGEAFSRQRSEINDRT